MASQALQEMFAHWHAQRTYVPPKVELPPDYERHIKLTRARLEFLLCLKAILKPRTPYFLLGHYPFDNLPDNPDRDKEIPDELR